MLGIYLLMLETEQERKRMSDVYKEFKLTLLYAAIRILHDIELSEDAVHNAYMSLIESKKLLFLPNEELLPLLITVVKRRAIDLARRRGRTKTENLDDMYNMPSMEEPVEVQISTSEDFEKMTDCIKRLDESHRIILQMKYYFELSNTEIGEQLGITNRKVALQLHSAKLKLRNLFREDE